MTKSFRALRNEITGGRHVSATDETTPKSVADGEIARSSREMQRGADRLPIYSNTPGSARAETDPAFSCEIAPGPDSGKPLLHGPAWSNGIAAGSQVSHSPNKSDADDVGTRGKPITY